ncbi:molybdenum cofactor biosynthesis protein MoaE [Pendulispora albinea]|uniref:Molybdopterin synthase catalytic subunit n=1 Tax=Pendulispora albinea TaxID=2741071 RepID=A0ABZ2M1S3_9BACT
MLLDIRQDPIASEEAVAHVSHAGAGAVTTFLGVVREQNEGRAVVKLEYQAYLPMARAELARIAAEIEGEIPGVQLAALHRVGALSVSDIAVVCAASAPHRDEAFRACRLLIDRIKERVPIWKREYGPHGAWWVGWVDARCSPDHDHAAHEHADHDHAAHEHADHDHAAHEHAPHEHADHEA